MDPQSRTQFQALASYEEELIGSRMTTNFVTLQASLSIKEAMTSVISQAAEHDNPIFNSWRIKKVSRNQRKGSLTAIKLPLFGTHIRNSV